MKRYTFQIVIEEGNDEYWEDFEERGVSGVEEVTAGVKEAMWQYYNDNATVSLVKYENDADV